MKDIYSNYDDFKSKVLKAVLNNEPSIIENIMLFKSYPNINKPEKEKEILRAALTFSFYNQINNSFLKYLIFDYQIGENLYFNMGTEYKSSIVDEMFAKRNLKLELVDELSNIDNPSKRPKI